MRFVRTFAYSQLNAFRICYTKLALIHKIIILKNKKSTLISRNSILSFGRRSIVDFHLLHIFPEIRGHGCRKNFSDRISRFDQ